MKYYKWIFFPSQAGPFGFQAWLAHAKIIAAFFSNPLRAAHTVFASRGGIRIEGILLCLIIAFLFLAGLRELRKTKKPLSFLMLNASLFLLTLFMMSLSPQVWAMHHVVLSFPFLFLALFQIIARFSRVKSIVYLFLLLIVINLCLYGKLFKLPVYDFAHPAMSKINTLLNERFSKIYLFIVLCDEIYHIKVLYQGKDQRLIFPGDYSNVTVIKQMKDLMEEWGRKALFIVRNDNDLALQMIQDKFPGCHQLQTDFDSGNWRIWYEK